jgi:hypothetical protein
VEEPENTPKSKLAGYQDLLSAEFSYIAQTAFQANEDRSRSSQFFLITFGTFLAALLSTQFDNVDLKQIYLAFAVAFVALAGFGALTILQITRLREAWMESVRAMNVIKDGLFEECPELRRCFRWTSESIRLDLRPGALVSHVAPGIDRIRAGGRNSRCLCWFSVRQLENSLVLEYCGWIGFWRTFPVGVSYLTFKKP